MSSRQPQKFTQTQPRTYRISLKAVLWLPFRICNPPPAVAKVRSCSATPLFQVRLEDVLDRKHLPPLGLKDFEEWLLFVEMSPENLYFILWLREYKQRYNQWKSQSEFQSRNVPSDYPLNRSSQHSSHLAMFYARAKQTFFTPGSEYELNLTSSLLAPFHKANMPPHPDPALFTEVELDTYRTLEASLRRFVRAQFNNVGNRRVLCGIVAGTLFTLIGGLTPLILNFVLGESRWSRLTALPGLWLGLTVVLAALHGVCLGVYVFGDLRQLRKFELSRPPISKPQPLPSFKRRPLSARPLSTPNSILPIQQPRKSTAPISNLGRGHCAPSISSAHRSVDSSHTTSTDDHIQISQAYYDADDTDGPDFNFPEKQEKEEPRPTNATIPAGSFNTTAEFIGSFDPMLDDEYDLEHSLNLPQRYQPMAPFDFDSLPCRPNFKASNANNKHIPSATTAAQQLKDVLPFQIPCPPEPAAISGLSGMIARMQGKCTIAKWRLQTGYLEPDTVESSRSPGSPLNSHLPLQPSSPHWSAHSNHPTDSSTSTKRASSESKTMSTDTEAIVRKRFRMMQAVPPFAVPLTRVLSPVIVRGQWEIVVRSAFAAFLVAWIIVGSLLAVPPITIRR